MIKKEFYSTVEKGKINPYLIKELRHFSQHANHQMKKKLHTHFMKIQSEKDTQIRPFTKQEQRDIQEFKELMRGFSTINDQQRQKIEKTCETLNELNNFKSA